MKGKEIVVLKSAREGVVKGQRSSDLQEEPLTNLMQSSMLLFGSLSLERTVNTRKNSIIHRSS